MRIQGLCGQDRDPNRSAGKWPLKRADHTDTRTRARECRGYRGRWRGRCKSTTNTDWRPIWSTTHLQSLLKMAFTKPFNWFYSQSKTWREDEEGRNMKHKLGISNKTIIWQFETHKNKLLSVLWSLLPLVNSCRLYEQRAFLEVISHQYSYGEYEGGMNISHYRSMSSAYRNLHFPKQVIHILILCPPQICEASS